MLRSVLVVALPAVIMLALLQGCNKKQQDCPKVADVVEEVKVVTEESYNCSVLEGADALKQTFCEARREFDDSLLSNDIANFEPYLKGFRDGINDARQAENSKVGDIEEGRNEKPYEAGYRKGYGRVVEKMVITEFNCSDAEQSSEYKDIWCEAEDAYRVAGVGNSDNLFLKESFINGYMKGGRSAMTDSSSMEDFLSGDSTESEQDAIVRPEVEGKEEPVEIAFHKGFKEGHKSMIDSIRESINQVMEQMQMPNDMQLPEGLMPPQPGQ